jgi:hypothetical protein
MGVTEADLPAGQEKRAERSGATVKRFDAAFPQMRPALRVAPGPAVRFVEVLDRGNGYAFRTSPAGPAPPGRDDAS